MNNLFLGIKGHIVCLNKQTGKELWRKKLRTSTLTNIVFDGESLHAYSRGHIFSLNPDTGAIIWENELSGLGYGYCIIAPGNANDYMQSVIAQDEQACAAGGSN